MRYARHLLIPAAYRYIGHIILLRAIYADVISPPMAMFDAALFVWLYIRLLAIYDAQFWKAPQMGARRQIY